MLPNNLSIMILFCLSREYPSFLMKKRKKKKIWIQTSFPSSISRKKQGSSQIFLFFIENNDDNFRSSVANFLAHHLLLFYFDVACHSDYTGRVSWSQNFSSHKKLDTSQHDKLSSYPQESPHQHDEKQSKKGNDYGMFWPP